MSALPPDPEGRRRALEALADELRPQLHRYAARLTGSVIDGEDVVQDAFVRALAAIDDLPAATPLRPWLVRIAHNRAIDLLRRSARHHPEPIEAAQDVPDAGSPDPEASLLRREAMGLAVSRFVELAVPQRSAVLLKDDLGESLSDIADLLGLSVDGVKAHLARGRARLRTLAAEPLRAAPVRPISAETQAFAELFNRQDWTALRARLARDVRLVQSRRPAREGADLVGQFFSIYAGYAPVRLVPAILEDREILLVFDPAGSERPAYFMCLAWRDGAITGIRDHRYARYVVEAAEVASPAPEDP